VEEAIETSGEAEDGQHDLEVARSSEGLRVW